MIPEKIEVPSAVLYFFLNKLENYERDIYDLIWWFLFKKHSREDISYFNHFISLKLFQISLQLEYQIFIYVMMIVGFGMI